MKRLLLLVALCVAVPVAGARPEKWYDAYNRGVEAVRAGNDAAGAQALQQAISEMPTENANARGRNEAFVYVPHFWLGIAKFNLGDVDGALSEFNISESQQVVQNTRYYADLRDWVSRVRAMKQKSSDSVAARGKREATVAVRAAVSAQGQALSSGADRTDTYRAGLKKLKEAQDVTARAGSDLQEYRRAAEIAVQAGALFNSAAEEQRRLKAAAKAPARAEASVPVTDKPAEVAVQAPPQKQQEQQVLTAAVAETRIAVQEYRRRLRNAAAEHPRDKGFREWVRRADREAGEWQKGVTAPLTDEAARDVDSKVQARNRELGLRVTDLERAAEATKRSVSPEEVHASLERAWRAFAAGDLGRAEELLTRVVASTQSAEAYLLRGCGRYTQAFLSKKPEAALASAESDLRIALKLNRSLRLDPKSFSPKLVAYFEKLKK